MTRKAIIVLCFCGWLFRSGWFGAEACRNLWSPALGPTSRSQTPSSSMSRRGTNQAVRCRPFRVGYYFSTDSTITNGDHYFGFCDFPPLQRREKGCSSHFPPFSFRVSPWVYYLGRYADILGPLQRAMRAIIRDSGFRNGDVTLPGARQYLHLYATDRGAGLRVRIIHSPQVERFQFRPFRSVRHLLGDGTHSGGFPLHCQCSKAWGDWTYRLTPRPM